LEVPFGKGNIYKIKRVLKSITPRGTTPIAGSLLKASSDFPPCADCRNIIILITDGVEACDGDPCVVSKRLQKKGIILKPFVIGIGLEEDFKSSFECVGTYFDAADENTFKNVLGVVISQALDNTTAQINLLRHQRKTYGNGCAYSSLRPHLWKGQRKSLSHPEL
jgi:Ca-activated chloride channel family protein